MIISGNIHSTYDLPVKNSYVESGMCGNKTQSISIEWIDKNQTNAMVLKFKLKEDKKSVYTLDEVVFNLSTAIFSESNNSRLKLFHEAHDFTTWLHWSYSCDKQQKLPLYTDHGKQYVGTLEVSYVWLEAFHIQNKKNFSPHIHCNSGLSTKGKSEQIF